MTVPMLFAAHISDGVLLPGWQAAGFVLAALLAWLGALRLREEEIPRVALLTAAFFISSLLHVPFPVGPTKVHLLLTGLTGIVLGSRAALAIPIGLALQFFLFQHGGFWSLGVNACVMGIPALVAWGAFRGLHRLPWWPASWFRGLIATAGLTLALLGLAFWFAHLMANFGRPLVDWTVDDALAKIQQPWLLILIVILGLALGWWSATGARTPEFTLGFLLGGGAVLMTTALNYLALLFLGEPDRWQAPALLQFVVHLALVPVEGLIVGSVVAFLARVKPEMIGC